MPTLVPDLVYRAGAFHPGLAVEVDAATGRITRLAPAAEVEAAAVTRLRDVALLPGFVNAHSHAFQRLIRGRTQWRPADDSASDFWSWREAMYHAALGMSPDDVYSVSRFCFLEMLRAGITTVGEFHYLHNDPAGRPYDDRAELARRVIAAARDVGIRISLLNVCYTTGAIGEALRHEQRRFGTPDVAEFVETAATLADDMDRDPLVTVGIAPHSVRAVPRDVIRALHDWSTRRRLPFHMHVSEQPAEVEACLAAYGRRPVEMLHDDGTLDERFTGIHATHITDDEVRMLARSGATVCACPTTERDLGDGILRAVDLVRAGGRIALGTDSQTVIDPLEDMRLVEYHERLQRLERVVITRAAVADRREPAPLLLDMATSVGARSLRLDAGALEGGMLADMVGVDLTHHTLAGWTPGTLASMITLSAPSDVISDVWVGGRHVVQDRQHAQQEEAMRGFIEVARALAGTA
jgi:formimidoylglutamate deiminase